MKTRDFINIGVFSAIYFVIVFSCGMLGIINPPMMFVGYALGIIANGAVIFLFKARVPKIGALAICGLLVSAMMLMTGHPWITLVLAPLLGLAADFLFAKKTVVSKVFGYAVMSLWYVTPWFPVFVDVQGYYNYIAESMGTAYADSMRWFLTPWMVVGWGVAVFIIGLIGGVFGNSVLNRHFRKAGIAK
ncbi:MptD family putative ECF transporter S component [Trueperella pyogenes]|uniref:MptD family putative ECF transporter S component n=1 Tax=Trueperella pyogenes TaxID=1661 RepID=X4QZ87_9ACTO|nr:MptD family putative ECF transporter S component [Trueperella pyogenes]AHU89786.1 permease [Trueperella pyogenes]AWA43802.1 permease [Trueperella pyogenes]AWG03757.1 permease [Trueperella pyogenes]AWG16488.1 permease [Trueperella pyogenes]AZR02509.1 Trep_Strep domain-containing protein [Trueperella pyogenes]